MAADLLAEWWVHDGISVERLAGEGAFGKVYADSVNLTGFVDDGEKLVRDASGQEVVSSARVFFAAVTADIPIGSKITLPSLFGSRETQVIVAHRRDGGSLGLPNHLELAVQ